MACPQGASLRSRARGMGERVTLLKGAVFVGPLGYLAFPLPSHSSLVAFEKSGGEGVP